MGWEQWMEQLADDAGLDDLEPEADGTCRFLCDEVEVSLRPLDEGTVLMEAPLRELPRELVGKVAQIALEANHLFLQTQGAAFALDRAGGRLVLRESAQVDEADDLERSLERFVAKAERWQALFDRYVQLQGASDSPADPDVGSEPGIPSGWLAV